LADARDESGIARERSGIEAHLSAIGSPSVGRGLHQAAEANEADLMVVGSSRRGLLGRVLIADDTNAALNGAPCAVAIAPAGYAQDPQPIKQIGVGYNGSPESKHAIKVGRALADERGTQLSAFESVSIPAYASLAVTGPFPDLINSVVQEAIDDIAGLGEVEPHAAYGQPAEELAIYSANLDLLIVGSRGYGPVGRLIHGSTTRQLASTARCPLLVLTRATRATDQFSDSTDEGTSVTANT
jgi:nucleotide-binding universal stress UspA family protein